MRSVGFLALKERTRKLSAKMYALEVSIRLRTVGKLSIAVLERARV